ncbi:MAG: MFS transporter [Magnetospirillum sp.]|nr:MFS transporter [Magnetospirillum sp.]
MPLTTPSNARPVLAMAALLTGVFLPPLDYFIVNLALPSIQTGLKTTAAQVQLIISAYALAYAVVLITGGRLGDLYGRKRIFMLGMAGFILSSALCGWAMNGTALIVGRTVQGVTAALITPQVLATIRTVFPAKAQSRLMGAYGFVFGLSSIVGQIGGGALIDLHPLGLGWRAVFLVNLPVGLLALVGAWRFVPENRPAQGAYIDLAGMLVLTMSLMLLIEPIISGRELGWPAWTILCLIASLPSFAMLLWVERRVRRNGQAPLVDLLLLRRPVVAGGLLIAFFFYSISVFFLTYGIFLQRGLGWSPFQSGLGIAPYGLGYVVGPLGTPWLARRVGDRLLPLGLGLMAGAFALVTWRLGGVPAPDAVMVAGLFAAGIGQGMTLPSLQRIVLADVAPHQAGLVAGTMVAVLYLGAAFSAAGIGGVFFTVLGHGRSARAYTHALQMALAPMVGALLVGLVLSLWLLARQSGFGPGWIGRSVPRHCPGSSE